MLGAIYVMLVPFGAGAAASWAAVEVTWAVLVLIGIWRCAPNSGQKIWGHLARLAVIVSIVGMAWHLAAVVEVVSTMPATVSVQGDDDAFFDEEEGDYVDEDEAAFFADEEDDLFGEEEDDTRTDGDAENARE